MDFYTDQFAAESWNMECRGNSRRALLNSVLGEKAAFEKELPMMELSAAVNQMASGWAIDFLKRFWNTLRHYFMEQNGIPSSVMSKNYILLFAPKLQFGFAK